MSDYFPKESDVRLWQTDLPFRHAYHPLLHKFLIRPMADLERDEEWAKEHDWEFFYAQNGDKVVKVNGKTITIPKRT